MKAETKGTGNLVMYVAIAALLIAVLYFGFSGSGPVSPTQTENRLASAIGYNSAVCKEVIRADGSREDLGCKKNLFTIFGKNITREALGRWVGAAVDYIAIANASAAQATADLSLTGEYTTCGLGRAQGSYATIGGGNWSISKVFTSTCDAIPINGTGLYNASSGNMLFAETTFTTATLQNNDQINITWFIWVT